MVYGVYETPKFGREALVLRNKISDYCIIYQKLHSISGLSMIVRMNVVLGRAVVVDSD